MANPSKIHSKPYRNWVRGALGLLYLQEGLHPFTDRVVKAEHTRILQTLTPCSSCTLRDILPEHAKAKPKVCIHSIRGKCNCKQKAKKECNTCGKIYDEIILHHRNRDPNWVADCSLWCSDHWQIAKCFMTTANQSSSNTASETDAAGLLSIIINGLFFDTEIQCKIDPPHDAFSQVREIRNEILHTSTLELTDNEVTKYIRAMVDLLEDPLTLINDPSAQAAVKKLKEIINGELVVTTIEEAKAVQIALDAIKKTKEQSEENIRELVEVKTSESLKQITTAKEHAKEEIQTASSEEFREKYEPELKKIKESCDDLENRLNAVETEQRELNERLVHLEKQVSKLAIAEEKHQKRLDYLKQKQDLQQYLVDQYQSHHVKTWISPLMTQYNSVDIEEVYVSPDMLMEEMDKNAVHAVGKTTDTTQKSTNEKERGETKLRQVSGFHDIFYTDDIKNKKIYIIGDVGTGKSSYCKMMMRNWCISVTNKKTRSEQLDIEKQADIPECDDNMTDISEFEFLFYVPLRIMSGYSDIHDMINSQLQDFRALLDDIFKNDSEHCLILVDGLDEWTSTNQNEPVLQSVRNATIVTTSRPYAVGVLDMKLSECDRRVTLLGIKHQSVQPMIEKYMRITLPSKSSSVKVSDCEQKLHNAGLGHLHKTPMLLQQMIWMYCRGHEIGKSTSFIYTNIVNILFAWVNEKLRKSFTLNLNPTSQIRDMQLPKLFDKYVRCQDNRELIMLLGKVAYDTFVTEGESAVVFGRQKLKVLGLSDDDISVVLTFGIFVEENSTDPTYEKSHISFIHTSFLEFFTAVFISGSYLPRSHTSRSKVTVLEDLLMQQSSAAGILRLQNVIIMVCGLSPFLTELACDCVYQMTAKDVQTMQITRDRSTIYNIERKIQEMCFKCLSESYSSKLLTPGKEVSYLQIKLRHLTVREQSELEQCIASVISGSIQTCSISFIQISREQCSALSSFLSKALYLQTLKMACIECDTNCSEGLNFDLSKSTQLHCFMLSRCKQLSVSGLNYTSLKTCKISDCELSHKQCSLLSYFLSQTVSLHTLKMSDIRCTKHCCEGHSIDLSSHNQLQSLKLYLSEQISVLGENNTTLKTCEISHCKLSHTQCSSLSSFLSQAVFLRTLTVEDISCAKSCCEGHSIDLSYHRQLQNLNVWVSNQVFVSGVSNKQLITCEIIHCELSHEQCSSLSTLLSQAVALQTLKIEHVSCRSSEYFCKGHNIDLCNHKQLNDLYLTYCNQVYVSGEHNTCLKKCEISNCKLSHEQYSLLSSFLSQAVSLQSLTLEYISCTKDGCERHNIGLFNHKQLRKLQITGSNQVCVSGLHNTRLETCEINNCTFSHEQCSSLSSFLSQAIPLQILKISGVRCNKSKCENHDIDLSNHEKLQSVNIHECNQLGFSGVNNTGIERCEIRDCELSHEQCSSLSSFISKSVLLQMITLFDVKCTKDKCDGHGIDLCDHRKLLSVNVHQTFFVFGLNNTTLETCDIRYNELSHEQYSSLSSFISQAVSLQNLTLEYISCTKDGCERHTIGLSNHKQLQKLQLTGSNQVCMSGLTNNTTLEICEINKCTLSHEQCSSLSSFLSQAVSLQSITVSHITCICDDCEGHCIDLSRHKQLGQFQLSNCYKICVSAKISTNLKSCEINKCTFLHEECSLLLSFLSQTVSLEQLTASQIRCAKNDCEGHCLDLSNHIKLQRLNMYECKQFCVHGLKCSDVKACEISNCILSHEQCQYSSFISQVGSAETPANDGNKCTMTSCRGEGIDEIYVKQLGSLCEWKRVCVSGEIKFNLEKCKIFNCKVSHKQNASLPFFLSQTALSLQTLILAGISCIREDCQGHNIDISNFEKLHSVTLSRCYHVSVSGTSYRNLKTVKILKCELSHGQCSTLSSFFSQTTSLGSLEVSEMSCDKNDCEGHCMDLTSNKQLQSLNIFECKHILVHGLNSSNFTKYDIKKCELSHEQCLSLLSVISHAVSLEMFTVSELRCTKINCKGHSIDLSNNKQLKHLQLSNCDQMCVSVVSNTSPRTCAIHVRNCHFSHEQCSSLSSFLSQAVALQTLTVSDIRCAKYDCEGHSIDLSNHVQLKSLHIHGIKQFCVNGIKHSDFMECEISTCELTHEKCPFWSLIPQEGSSQKLEIGETCIKGVCEGYSSDQCNDKQKQRLRLYECIKICALGKIQTDFKTCDISNCKISHEQCSLLTSIFSQALSLQSLKMSRVVCNKFDCKGHSMDLSNQKQLKHLDMSFCSRVCISGKNNANLETCDISHCEVSHHQFSSLSSVISQAVSLQMLILSDITCTQGSCEGHSIDLSPHILLRRLELYRCSFTHVYFSSANYDYLEICEICDCKLSHKQFSSLSSFLSESVSVQILGVYNITCTEDECEGHKIDLSHHKTLRSLELYSCSFTHVCFSSANYDYLKICEICDCKLSHKQFSSLSSFLSQNVSVQRLGVYDITCTEDECEGHKIDLSHHKVLRSLELYRCSFTRVCFSSANYDDLEICEICDCKLSHEQYSLLLSCLSQTIPLRRLRLIDIQCTRDSCDGHSIDLSRHTRLRSLQLYRCSFTHVCVSSANYDYLEICDIDKCKLSHEQYSLLLSCLSQTISLQMLTLIDILCTKDSCEGHNIDLCHHKRLRSLQLNRCNQVCFSSVYINNLEVCVIINCKLSHELCLTLQVLSKTVQLKRLILNHITCNKIHCPEHVRNLSRCKLSNDLCSSLSSFLSRTVSLQWLKFSDITCAKDICDSHSIDLLNHKHIRGLQLYRCDHVCVSGGMNAKLKNLEISECKLSHEQYSSLISFISQTVSLQTLLLEDITCTMNGCEGHSLDLSNNKLLYCVELYRCKELCVSCINNIHFDTCEIRNCKFSLQL